MIPRGAGALSMIAFRNATQSLSNAFLSYACSVRPKVLGVLSSMIDGVRTVNQPRRANITGSGRQRRSVGRKL